MDVSKSTQRWLTPSDEAGHGEFGCTARIATWYSPPLSSSQPEMTIHFKILTNDLNFQHPRFHSDLQAIGAV
eukprot:761518-Hanusia_phi.AAC.6